MIIRIATAAALVVAGIAGAALAQGKQDFRLSNRTGYTIAEVYVAPSKSDDWEEDVMGRDTLDDGGYVDISFPRKEKTCSYDLKVVYDDEETAEWQGLDLCSVSKISLRYNRKTGETWADSE